MPQTLGGIDAGGLEQSRSRRSDSIRFGPSAHGIERAEVYLSTCAFEPHRHDTYAIGITTAGVQTFHYRGSRRICLPGQLHVLHPDEAHDGAAGTDGGFGYRILYIPPELVRDALAGRELPFVADPIQPLVPAARLEPRAKIGRPVRYPSKHPSCEVRSPRYLLSHRFRRGGGCESHPATWCQAIGSLELTRQVALVSEAGLVSSPGN